MTAFELQLSRVARIELTGFRNYAHEAITLAPPRATPAAVPDGDIVALVGPNGAGKTNVLEALSLFTPGRGLRGAALADMTYRPARAEHGTDREAAPLASGFTLSARIETGLGTRQVGLGVSLPPNERRAYRLDGARARGAGAYADFLAFVWLTPQQDGLFRGPAEERRRFMDQLASALDPSYASAWAAYQNSARQRLKLLKQAAALGQPADAAWLDGLEDSMARHGTTAAVARRAMVPRLSAIAQNGHAPFPGARLAIAGVAEEALDTAAAVDVEARLRVLWREERGYDQRFARTHSGPHRSDLRAWHAEHGTPANTCSTGEQKAMLIAVLLSHAKLVELQRLVRPILLLDEVTAHLDPARREALLSVLATYGGQCWLTGTDLAAFPGLDTAGEHVALHHVEGARVSRWTTK